MNLLPEDNLLISKLDPLLRCQLLPLLCLNISDELKGGATADSLLHLADELPLPVALVYTIIAIRNLKQSEMANKRERNSPEYREWRAAVLERDNFECQHCGSEENLHAHHIVHFIDDEERRTDVDNGITLCADCHRKLHSEEARRGR
jgi:hypothetical protein